MEASSRRSAEDLFVHNKNRTHHTNRNANKGLIVNNSPDRSPIWIEPTSKTTSSSASAVVPARKVQVLYYLTRNGHLEHPHLIDVPLSSPHGLYLRDVMNTLNYHRGKGMANMYSWSFKRTYKNGYVWHDASEDDLIQSTNGHDYVLKGSELLQTHPPNPYRPDTNCTSTTPISATVIRRNQSWSSFANPQEYLVVKCESSRDLAAKFVESQTEEQRRGTVELGTDEIPSPPPSNSSSEVSDAVSGRRYVDRTVKVKDGDRTVEDEHGGSGRMKASQVLMQLITCGSDSVRDVGTVRSKADQRCTVSVEYGKSLRSEALNQ